MRSMSEGRTISVNRTFAPNEFSIELGAEDYERFSQMEANLLREFSDLVIDQAKENRWGLMGAPRISFVHTDALGKGEFRVDALLTADRDGGAPRAPVKTGRAPGDACHRTVFPAAAESRASKTSGAVSW